MPRDHATCQMCGHVHSNIVRWDTLQMTCAKCQAITLLPPAAPLVERMATAGHLHFTMHGEKGAEYVSNLLQRPPTSCIGSDGVYHVQWRGVELTDEMLPGPDDEWRNPKKCVKPSSIISKKNLSDAKRYQVRVRARLGRCTCGLDNPAEEYAYLKCADGTGDGDESPSHCMWTPWSLPSALATPAAIGGAGEAPPGAPQAMAS